MESILVRIHRLPTHTSSFCVLQFSTTLITLFVLKETNKHAATIEVSLPF